MVDASTREPKFDVTGEVEPGSEAADLSNVTEAKQRSTGYWILVLLILVLLSEEVAYAFNLVTPALPSMAISLQTDSIAWISTAFTLAGAVTAPLIGKLADRQGKKRWLLISAVVMACGSMIVALAPTFALTLFGRTVEGVGLAIVPISYSLIRDIFPKKMIAIAVSISTAGIGVTGILGPIFAGWLIDGFGYRGVFWALAIFPLVIAALAFFFVPESPIRVRSSIDWLGGLLLGVGIALILFAIGEGGTWGWLSGPTLGLFAVGVVMLLVFGWWEQRTPDPLIEFAVLKSRGVLTTMVANFTAQAVIVIQFILLSFIVQVPISLGLTYGLGESAEYMARITTPGGIASVAMGFLVGWLAERRGARLPNMAGFVLMGIGSVMLAFSHDSFGPIMLAYLVYAFGGGLVSAAIPNLVIGATPVHLQAVTASTVGLLGSLGSAVAVQVVFALLALNVVTVVQGTPIYAGSGFTTVYWVAAGLSLIGLLVTVMMRHGRRPQSIEAHI